MDLPDLDIDFYWEDLQKEEEEEYCCEYGCDECLDCGFDGDKINKE